MSGTADRKTALGRLPKTVIGLGVVSLFTDVSSEAAFPLLPVFLTTLGASNVFIGLVEGAAELTANVLKYIFGLLADRQSRLKPLVLAGYGISTLIRPLLGFTRAPWQVLTVRVGERIGKGVRTSPRDALITAATDPGVRGRAFGFHRAMDHAGAALGTLLAVALLWLLGVATTEAATADQLRTLFLWAAIPGALALVALSFTPEPPRTAPAAAKVEKGPLPGELKKALAAVALFAFANASDAFVIVKAVRLGAAPLLAPLLWLALHLVKASTATFGGRLSDRYGHRRALALGWTVYAVTWSAVGFADSMALLFVLTAVYGTSHGLVEGAEKALIAELASSCGKGRAFGWYNMLVGFAALVSSVTFGAVWDRFGALFAFAGFGAVALLAAMVLMVLVPAKEISC